MTVLVPWVAVARHGCSPVFLAAGLLLEAACQGLYAFGVAPPLAARRKDPLHYFEASGDPVLCTD